MKRTIRFKIVSRALCIVVIGFLIVILVIGQMITSILERNVFTTETSRLLQYVNYIGYMQESINHFGGWMAIEEKFQALYEEDIEFENRWHGYKDARVKNYLKNFVLQRPDCSRIDVVFRNGDYYSSEDKTVTNYYEHEYYKIFKQKNHGQGFAGFYDQEMNAPLANMEGESVIYIMGTRYIENPAVEFADIVFFMDKDDFFVDFVIDDSSIIAYKLLDSNGETVIEKGQFSAVAEEAMKKETEEERVTCSNRNTLIFVKDGDEKWTVVAEVSKSLLMQEIQMTLFMIIGIMILDCIFLALFLLLLLLRMLEPVETLKTACKAIGAGDFQFRLQIHTGDDFEELGNAYIQMQENLQDYTTRILQYEKNKREMEIDRLMLQINPHFIYNTLSVISYMAEEKGCSQIEKFTNAFIELLKDSLRVSTSDCFTTLRQEIINIRNYVVLQQIRYEAQFELNIFVQEELLDCYVPNVLLQPIVENAIFHGVLAKDEKGHIVVRAERCEDNLHISVVDDGIGMEPEVIEEILMGKRLGNDFMRKIGIGNVKKRIEYIYGASYGIEIYSEVDKGTEVILKIPCEFEQRKE